MYVYLLDLCRSLHRVGAPGARFQRLVEVRRRQGHAGGHRRDPGAQGRRGLAHGVLDLLPLQGVD